VGQKKANIEALLAQTGWRFTAHWCSGGMYIEIHNGHSTANMLLTWKNFRFPTLRTYHPTEPSKPVRLPWPNKQWPSLITGLKRTRAPNLWYSTPIL
jgi:hypothetical protein